MYIPIFIYIYICINIKWKANGTETVRTDTKYYLKIGPMQYNITKTAKP